MSSQQPLTAQAITHISPVEELHYVHALLADHCRRPVLVLHTAVVQWGRPCGLILVLREDQEEAVLFGVTRLDHEADAGQERAAV